MPQEYDGMVCIIEATTDVTLLDAKEMLRRRYETLNKREQKETALKTNFRRGDGGARGRGAPGRNRGSASRGESARGSGHTTRQESGPRNGSGVRQQATAGVRDGRNVQCYRCKKFGHFANDCARGGDDQGEFVFSASSNSGTRPSTWLLDSGTSRHTTCDVSNFIKFRQLTSSVNVTVANGQRLEAKGEGSVCLKTRDGKLVKRTGVLFAPQLDSKFVSVPALTSRGALVQFQGDSATLVVGETVVATIPRIGKPFAWELSKKRMCARRKRRFERTARKPAARSDMHASVMCRHRNSS